MTWTTKNARAYRLRADAALGRDNFNGAIADYTQAIRLAPKDPRPLVQRGMAYFRKSDFDSALADFGEALRLNRGDKLAKRYRDMAEVKKKALRGGAVSGTRSPDDRGPRG